MFVKMTSLIMGANVCGVKSLHTMEPSKVFISFYDNDSIDAKTIDDVEFC